MPAISVYYEMEWIADKAAGLEIITKIFDFMNNAEMKGTVVSAYGTHTDKGYIGGAYYESVEAYKKHTAGWENYTHMADFEKFHTLVKELNAEITGEAADLEKVPELIAEHPGCKLTHSVPNADKFPKVIGWTN